VLLGRMKCSLSMGLRVLGALSFALLLGSPVTARAATLDFENTSINDRMPVADGYGGVNWNNFYSLDSSTLSFPSGYGNGTISGDWVALNGFGDPASISSAAGFNLDSGYFTAAWNSGLKVAVWAYGNGGLAYTKLLTLNPFTPTFVDFSFANVRLVIFEASGGVDAGLGATGTHFVIDNLNVAATPIPAALPLFATALAGLGFAAKRRRRARSAL
jgi:hypothetical protein